MHNMGAIQYKDASFYTSYFKSIEGFILKEEFKRSTEEGEHDLYVGYIEAVESMLPLSIRVEIPESFPYSKLVFRTKSLKGYPHLIFTGKTKHGSWFCLNTPFAETAEEQLNQEISRLKEWISRQMRRDLPAVIEDSNVIYALRVANAYNWENWDEMKEYSAKATLTFVGDFHNSISNFKEEKGYLACIKTKDCRFYALGTSEFAKEKLPYVIVTKEPTDGVSKDFMKMAEYYGWDGEMRMHLLPNINLDQSWRFGCARLSGKDWDESSALELIDEVEVELGKDDSYLPGSGLFFTQGSFGEKEKLHPMRVPDDVKPVLLKELERIREMTIANHRFCLRDDLKKYGNHDPYEDWEPSFEDNLSYFALAIRSEDGELHWYLFVTSYEYGESERITFDLKIRSSYTVQRKTGHRVLGFRTQSVTHDMFFGRGAFSQELTGKRIALVGLGAIGSMVAESLCRSGVHTIGLWDTDLVEPGNICRSGYTLPDMGESKILATKRKLFSINPFISANEIHCGGNWIYNGDGKAQFRGGSFYGEINYDSQEAALEEINGYDIIIDCTASNEMLHFLSYAVKDKKIISLCITNHADNLLCITNRDGNPFELRKAYLSRIEQDTKNFYLEGSGCYSPTFLATHSDISALVGIALKEINHNMEQERLLHSCIFSYDKRGILKDTVITYHLEGYDISMTICSETILDAEEIAEEAGSKTMGYLLGAYSTDRKSIMITHVVSEGNAESKLEDAFATSKGIIDYIGDFAFSGAENHSYSEESFRLIEAKAADSTINTCNPILATYNTDGTIDFFLFINDEMVPFIKEDC